MASQKVAFFNSDSFAVVGNSQRKAFPRLTYQNLRRMGKTVYPIDLGGASTIEGDTAFSSISELPQPVEAAIVEVPRDRTMQAVKPLVEAGITKVWLHQRSDTPAVVKYLRDHNVDFHTNGCAVMYTNNRMSIHSVHRRLWKLLGKY